MTSYSINYAKLSGSVVAPPSKSHTLRAVLFASMARGKSVIRHCLQSPDLTAMINACKQLGAQIHYENGVAEIEGVAGKPRLPDDVINAGNSGQVLRFVAAIAAITDGYVVLTGDHSVRYNRPVKPLMDGLAALGAECISTKGDNHAPIIIKGPISAGTTSLDGEDSQPVSGLLIASAFLEGTTNIHVNHPGEKPWVGLTLAWFDRLGIPYTHNNFEHYRVEGGHIINAFEYTVPGDFSSIAYPLVAALVTQSQITIENIDMNDAQGDKKIIAALRQMGADILIDNNSIIVGTNGTLQACDIDVNDFIDALPILAVVGCYAEGTTRLLNAGIARKKESDRLATITLELNKMGAKVKESQDSLIIEGSDLIGASVDSHNDHRIAMSLAVAACGIKMNSTIHHVACVAKSYPNFFNDMQSLGCSFEMLA